MTTAMKLLAFTTFIGVAFCSPLDVFYISYPLEPYGLLEGLQVAWKLCGENNTNEEIYKEILKEASDCYGGILQNNQSTCRSFENNFLNCSQSLVDFYVDCLPQKSKDLPSIALKAVASMVKAFCTSSGELLIEIFNSCFHRLIYKSVRNECKRENVFAKINKFQRELPSKAEVCQFGEVLESCFQEVVKDSCQSTKASELVTLFYNAAHSACK